MIVEKARRFKCGERHISSGGLITFLSVVASDWVSQKCDKLMMHPSEEGNSDYRVGITMWQSRNSHPVRNPSNSKKVSHFQDRKLHCILVISNTWQAFTIGSIYWPYQC